MWIAISLTMGTMGNFSLTNWIQGQSKKFLGIGPWVINYRHKSSQSVKKEA